jgi:hypothetical protein
LNTWIQFARLQKIDTDIYSGRAEFFAKLFLNKQGTAIQEEKEVFRTVAW